MGILPRIALVGCLLGAASPVMVASACEWTGAGIDNRWSTAANWRNCNGGRPQNGALLTFPDGAQQPANVNDIAGLQVSGIQLIGRGSGPAHWDITAAADGSVILNVSPGPAVVTFIAEAPADPSGNGPSFRVPITLGVGAGNLQVIVANGNSGDKAPLRLGDINLNGEDVQFDNLSPITVDGRISGNGLAGGLRAISMTGAVLTLHDNSYIGHTSVGGTLIAATSRALGASGPDNVAELRPGGVLRLSDGVVIDQAVQLRGGTLTAPAGASATVAGTVVIMDALSALQPAGTLTITGRVTREAASTLTQRGGGTLILSNPQNDWSSLTLEQGTLRAGAQGAIPAAAALRLSLGATPAILDLNDLDVTVGALSGSQGGQVRLGAGTLTVNQQAGGQNYSGTITGAGNFVKSGAGLLFLGGAQPNSHTGTTTVRAGILRLGKTSSNTTVIGPLIVNDADVEILTKDQIADTVPVTLNAGGVLGILDAETETIGSLQGTDGVLILGTGRLTVGADNTSTTFAGAIAAQAAPAGSPADANVRLVKIGAGTLTLTRAGTLSEQGVIAIDAGTLAFDGRMTVGSVVVRQGGTFAGTGEISGLNGVGGILMAAGGAISPGHSPGTLHADAAHITQGGSLVVQLDGLAAGSSHDQLDLTGDLTLAPDAQLIATRGFEPLADTTFTIVKLAPGKSVTGAFAGLPEGGTLTLDGRRFGITYHGGDGNDVVLTVLDDPSAPTPITYYLSEGATGDFFDADVLIANPNGAAAPVTLTFSKENGEQVVVTRSVPAGSHLTVHVDQIPGLEATSASAQVTSESGKRLMVERSMFWDQTYHAGHTGSAVDKPAADWFFAEGSQGFFDTFVLIINPNPTPADVTFTFVRENETPVVKTVTVGANARLTLHAGQVPELVDRSFGIAVHATQPIMAERAMYFSTPARQLSGGHESAGVTAPSKQWFLAEGATGGFFDTFVLLSNPQNTPAQVTLQYLLDTGETVTVPKTLAANARLTTNVEAEDDVRLRNAAMSTVVTSDVPIIAERSMYWVGAAPPWGESHNSFGVVEARTTWGLAEGRTGGPLQFHTYILLANPQATDANVTVTFLRGTGAPVAQTYTVPKTSRFNIDTNAIPGLEEASFGALIKVTNGVPIIVERSMYWDVNGVQFSGGTNATGISLPDSIASPAPGPGPATQVDIVGINGAQSFSPNPASATPGQAITWKNSGGGVTHRIVANDGSFDTGNIGGSATSTPVTVGSSSVNYHCSIHPSMTGTITVSAAAATTPACSGSSCR